MKIVKLIARVVLGLALVVFGLNKFLNFMPPFELSGDAAALMGALANSYIFNTVAIVEIVTGALLLLGMFVPLSLLVLFPISLNWILFHATLDPANLLPALVLFIIQIYLMLQVKASYLLLLRPKGL